MPKEQVSQEVTAEVTGAPKSKGPIKPSVPESLKKTIIKKKNPEAFKEAFSKVGKIRVKPYLDPNRENMGL